MYCKHCGNELGNNSKFCGKCGHQVDVEISSEKNKAGFDIEKLRSNLKNTGNSVSAIGWLTIIINIGIYILNVFVPDSGLPASDLSGTVLMIAVSVVFIVLGRRIKDGVDKNIKRYLQALLGLAALTGIWVVSTGGRVGFLFFLIIFYLISSLLKINKAMRNEEFVAKLHSPKYLLDAKGWIIFALATVVVVIIAASIDLAGTDTISNSPQSTNSQYNTSSKSELIKETVIQTKSSLSLPNQIDEVTKLVDITAESDAIRYHYILSGIDSTQLSNAYLKSYVGKGICQNSDTKAVLDEGINMEYSYVVSETGQTYLITFTKADCI